MFTQKNNLLVWVGKYMAAETAAATLIDNYTDLIDSEIALIDLTTNKTIQNAASATGPFRLVHRRGTQLLYSPIFSGGTKIQKTKSRTYVDALEQISYVGWNGTSGAFQVTDSKLYLIRISIVDSFKEFGNKIMSKVAEFKSGVSTTQALIADGLYDSLLHHYSDEVEKTMKIERVAAGGTLTTPTGSSNVQLLTKDSKTVAVYIKTGDATATFTASTASFSAGDVVQFPSTTSRSFVLTSHALGSGAGSICVYINTTAYLTADTGTDAQNAAALAVLINAGTQATATVTDTTNLTIVLLPHVDANVICMKTDNDSTWANIVVTNQDTVPVVYKVAAATSSAATYELDYPWVGETCYVVDGTTVGSCSGVLTATGAYGIKFSGVRRTNFVAGVFKYAKNRFKLTTTVDGSTPTTTVTYSQVARDGVGVEEQIRELEWFAAGNQYNYGQRVLQPGDQTYTSEVVENKRYDTLSFTIIDDNDVVTLTGASPKSQTEVILAFEINSHQGEQLVTSMNTLVGMTDFAAIT